MAEQLAIVSQRSAVLSSCGLFRYRLHREISPGIKQLLWLMLNPSIADACVDDPTIRKCIGFTKRLGFNRLAVGNLFAYRATDPKDLFEAHRSGIAIGGPDNLRHVAAMLHESSAVALAWGSHGKRWANAVNDITTLANLNAIPKLTLGPCKSGQPRHPLMVGYDDGLAYLRSGAAHG